MKKLFSYSIFSILLLVIFSLESKGQSAKMEEGYSFGLRSTDPVVMDVTRTDERITFNAENKSYFPYSLTIKFSSLQNLLPRIFERTEILHPGNNRLFELGVVDKTQSTQYDYSVSYSMKLSDDPDLSFPYLIPIGAGKTVQFQSFKKENSEVFIINQFMMNYGDTVFAVRKGIVTALPGDDSRVDRVIKASSLEILHKDGTLAIYRGLDPAKNKLHRGQLVFPGQTLGNMEKNGTLILQVLANQGPSMLKGLDIFYSDKNGEVISSKKVKNSEVFYPVEIVKKEMTDREIKKYEKGKLF